jgi:hypothetical protein
VRAVLREDSRREWANPKGKGKAKLCEDATSFTFGRQE